MAEAPKLPGQASGAVSGAELAVMATRPPPASEMVVSDVEAEPKAAAAAAAGAVAVSIVPADGVDSSPSARAGADAGPPLLQAASSAGSALSSDEKVDARYVIGADGKLVKEKYRIAEEKDYMRCFATFDIDKTGVNASQVYAIQNMLNQPSKEPSWQDLEEAFDGVDTDHNGSINATEYTALLKQLSDGAENKGTGKKPTTKVLLLILFLWFFPFLAPFARPNAETDSFGELAFFGLKEFLRATGLPHRYRQRILNSTCWFILFWLTFTLFEAGVLVNFALNGSQVKFTEHLDPVTDPTTGVTTTPDPIAQAGYVARIEPVIPFALAWLATVMLPFMFVASDSDLVEAREKVKEHGPLYKFVVKVSKKDTIQCKTAEDVLAYLFYRNEEQKREHIKNTKWRWLASALASLALAIAPFVVRIIYGYPFFGTCFASENCESKTNAILLTMAVFSFFGTFFTSCWFTFFLMSSAAAYSERLTLMTRLESLLDEDKAKAAGMPYLIFESPANVIVWSKLRTYCLAFKNLELRKCEILLSTLLFAFALIFAFILYQAIQPFKTEINATVLFVTTGYTVAALGAFICYPTIYTALSINNTQTNIQKWLSEEQWRLIIRTETAHNAEKKPVLEKCYRLTKALAQNIKEIDTTFTILGVAITPALFGSMVAALVASAGSWVASILFA